MKQQRVSRRTLISKQPSTYGVEVFLIRQTDPNAAMVSSLPAVVCDKVVWVVMTSSWVKSLEIKTSAPLITQDGFGVKMDKEKDLTRTKIPSAVCENGQRKWPRQNRDPLDSHDRPHRAYRSLLLSHLTRRQTKLTDGRE